MGFTEKSEGLKSIKWIFKIFKVKILRENNFRWFLYILEILKWFVKISKLYIRIFQNKMWLIEKDILKL